MRGAPPAGQLGDTGVATDIPALGTDPRTVTATLTLVQLRAAAVVVEGGVTREQHAVYVTLPAVLSAARQAAAVSCPVPANVLVVFPRTIVPAITATHAVVANAAVLEGESLSAIVRHTSVFTLTGTLCKSQQKQRGHLLPQNTVYTTIIIMFLSIIV